MIEVSSFKCRLLHYLLCGGGCVFPYKKLVGLDMQGERIKPLYSPWFSRCFACGCILKELKR